MKGVSSKLFGRFVSDRLAFYLSFLSWDRCLTVDAWRRITRLSRTRSPQRLHILSCREIGERLVLVCSTCLVNLAETLEVMHGLLSAVDAKGRRQPAHVLFRRLAVMELDISSLPVHWSAPYTLPFLQRTPRLMFHGACGEPIAPICGRKLRRLRKCPVHKVRFMLGVRKLDASCLGLPQIVTVDTLHALQKICVVGLLRGRQMKPWFWVKVVLRNVRDVSQDGEELWARMYETSQIQFGKVCVAWSWSVG